jgi:hypothetical protein
MCLLGAEGHHKRDVMTPRDFNKQDESQQDSKDKIFITEFYNERYVP